MVKFLAPEQLDLFGEDLLLQQPSNDQILNGAYYERATDKFVYYVLGKRHFEEPAKGCPFLKEWQERTKKERAI